MGDLGPLSFGRDDAESDFGEGGLLRAGFLRTEAYEAALAGTKRLIIGRKGSGKSAICVVLAAFGGDGFVASLLTPDDASLDVIHRFELQGLTDEMAKALFWRYMLEIQVAKFVVAHTETAHKRKPRSVRQLRRFLKDNNELADPKLHGQFWKGIQRLDSLSIGAFGAQFSVEMNAPSEGLRTSNRLNVVERGIQRALADLDCADTHARLLLLVDQIEQVWSNDPASDTMVTGLLIAAKQVSKELPGIRCVVFLRSDIYDALQFAEADKFHVDEMRIDWSPAALRDLLLARAQASLGREITSDQLWTEVFPPSVAGQPASDYLIARTQLRPRDVIQFANVCRDTARRNGHDRVLDSDVEEAELQYSRWKLGDLVREYQVNYPFLAHLFAAFENSGFIVSRATIEKIVEPLRPILLNEYPEYASAFSPDNIIGILYGVGFLGVERLKQLVYIYQDTKRVEPGECRFYIHPSLRLALGARSATALYPYRPALITGHLSHARRLPALGVGAEAPLGPDISAVRLKSIVRAGDRITRRLEDLDLPLEVAHEVYEQIQEMLRDTAEVEGHIRSGQSTVADVNSFFRWAITFLAELGNRLQHGSVGDDRQILVLARTLEDEARRLEDEARRT